MIPPEVEREFGMSFSWFPGSRVFVNIPKTGYVGVGTVKEEAVPVKDFKVYRAETKFQF